MGGAPGRAGPGPRQQPPAGVSPRVRKVGPAGPGNPPAKGPRSYKFSAGKPGNGAFNSMPNGGGKPSGKPLGFSELKSQSTQGPKNKLKTTAGSLGKKTQIGNSSGSGSSNLGHTAAKLNAGPAAKQGPGGKPASLTKGPLAQKLNLAKQYALANKGDVALKLGLPNVPPVPAGAANVSIVNNVINLNRVTNIFAPRFRYWQVNNAYIGWVGPGFGSGCFWMNSWGPYYFPKYVLYPTWCPWVNWCWHYCCPPLLDPRPLWCRPVVYVAAPCCWVYWAVPVWTPLPVVSCGSYVDVEPVVVGPAHDLQLLAIRFVDAGHPEEQLGPQYRVWFRNNSERAIRTPFNVMLFTSADGTLAADLPQSGVRVTSIEAGQVQAVDVRLPIEVYSMEVDENGRPAPFTTLHALVDAAREVPEVYEANNGAKVGREEILPIDPVVFAVEPGTAAAGDEVVLAGEGLGPAPGQVLVVLGEIEMESEIAAWMDHGLRVALPNVPVAAATEAQLVVVRGDGIAANPVTISVTPPALRRQPTPAPSPPLP